jgi:hypothetical protein
MVIDCCITIKYFCELSTSEKKLLVRSSINGEHGGSGNFEASLVQKNGVSQSVEPRLKNSAVFS